jgi:hypothetical protein
MDGGLPVGERKRFALVVGNRDEPELIPPAVDARQVFHVQATVQGGQGLVRIGSEQREMDHVGMKVDDVELIHAVQNFAQHRQVGGEVGLQRRGVEADSLVANRDQARPGLGVSAGEQGDIVAQIHQGVRQMRHDALGSSIQLRRDGLVKRGDLRDLHDMCSAPPSRAAQ